MLKLLTWNEMVPFVRLGDNENCMVRSEVRIVGGLILLGIVQGALQAVPKSKKPVEASDSNYVCLLRAAAIPNCQGLKSSFAAR